MCAPVSQTRPESSEGELLDDSNFPSRRHCGSPSFLRDSSFHRSRVCVPLSLRQHLIHQEVNLLMFQLTFQETPSV